MKKIFSFLLLAGICLFGAQNVKADVTYPIGSKIYFDATAYGSGMNIFLVNCATGAPAGSGDWWASTNEIIVFTLTSQLNANTFGALFKSAASNWQNVAMTAPDDNSYNMIVVNADGKTYSWAVYSEPSVSLTASEKIAHVGDQITLTASSDNFSGAVTYTYYYSTDAGANYTIIGSATASTSQTFTMGDHDYKFKVVATDATNTKEATVSVAKLLSCTAVGSSTQLFGTDWAPTLSANDMTYNVGVFTWSKEDVYLSAGQIEYKVALNQGWDVSYPIDNATYDVENAGFYNVTITLNWGTKEVNLAATPLYPAKVQLIGTFTNWKEGSPIDLVYNEGVFSASVPFVPAETAPQYKISITTSSESLFGTGGTSDPTMDRAYNQNWTFSKNGVHAVYLDADVAGNYVFSVAFSGGDTLVSVTYPNFKRNVANTNYISLCLPYAVATLDNATAYNITSSTQDAVTISPVALPLEAGKPYIIKPTAAGIVEATFQDVDQKAAAPVDNGLLRGNLSATPLVLNPNDANYAFYVLSGNVIKLVVAGEQGDQVTVGQYRAYAALSKSLAPELRIIEANNGATNIENVEANDEAVKFFQNGQLFIKKNGVTYNAVGAVVK